MKETAVLIGRGSIMNRQNIKNGQTLDKKVVWFNADLRDGLDSSNDYVFGVRAFSVYEANDSENRTV